MSAARWIAQKQAIRDFAQARAPRRFPELAATIVCAVEAWIENANGGTAMSDHNVIGLAEFILIDERAEVRARAPELAAALTQAVEDWICAANAEAAASAPGNNNNE
jgi:hypothetical protein